MRQKYRMFLRGTVHWGQDNTTGKQESLGTKDRAEAKRLFNARTKPTGKPRRRLPHAQQISYFPLRLRDVKNILVRSALRIAGPRFLHDVAQLFRKVSVSLARFRRRQLESNGIKARVIAVSVTLQQGFQLRSARHTCWRLWTIAVNGKLPVLISS